MGLSVTTPADDGTGFTEPAGGAYARIGIVNNATNFPAAVVVSGLVVKRNGAKFTFPNPTGTWGLISYWGMFLASTGGLPVYHAALETPITPKNGNTPVEFDLEQWSLFWS